VIITFLFCQGKITCQALAPAASPMIYRALRFCAKDNGLSSKKKVPEGTNSF
jgi:hypothetical protein